MAESGKVTGKYSNNDDVYISLEWKLKSQDKDSNTSIIHCELWLRGKDSYRHWNFYDHTKYIMVDGAKKTDTKTHFDTFKNPCKLMSGDFKVKHSANGTSDFNVSAKHYSGVKLGTATISKKNFTLPVIKRVSKINSVSIINEYKGVKVGYTKYNPKFSDTLVITCGSFTKTVKNYKSSNTVAFSGSEVEQIKKVIGESTSVTFKCYLKTYDGSLFLGNSSVLSKSGKVTKEDVDIYIKLSSASIKKVKGVYIKLTDSSIKKVKNSYMKLKENSIVKN